MRFSHGRGRSPGTSPVAPELHPAATGLSVTHAVYARAARIPTPVTGVGVKTGHAQPLSKGLARRRMSFLHATAVPAPPIPVAGHFCFGRSALRRFLTLSPPCL